MNDTKIDYMIRIHKVQDYIDKNLGNDLSLDILSNISGFSKFHFHRIFRGIVGETLLSYINRIRLERTLDLILKRRDLNITDIAMMLGYSDSASFARSFKNFYGYSASEVRDAYSKNCKEVSKIRKAIDSRTRYTRDRYYNTREETSMLVKVEVREEKAFKAIYLRHTGSYESLGREFPKMIGQLMNYAQVNQLIDPETFKLFAIYHDNPEYTEPENLKTSVCVRINGDIEPSSQMGILEIPEGKYGVGHFEVALTEISEAWNYMYGKWLPESGLQPSEGYVYEAYLNDPKTHPEGKQILEIFLPVKSI